MHLSLTVHENNLVFFTSENSTKLLRPNSQFQGLNILSATTMTFDKLLDIFSGNPLISKLKMRTCIIDPNAGMSAEAANRLMNEHPLIKELDLPNIFADIALILIRNLKSMKQLSFHLKNQNECQFMLSQLDNKWKHDISSESSLHYHYI